jgi:hypothetical protein
MNVSDVKPGKDSKERMASIRSVRRAAGFTEILIWAHPKDVSDIRAFAYERLAVRDKKKMFVAITRK